MKQYKIKYDGKIYSNTEYYFLSTHNPTPIPVEKGELPFSLKRIYKVEETDNNIIFYDGDLFFDMVLTKGIFKEEYKERFCFNKKTFRSTGDKLSYEEYIKMDNSESLVSLLMFISKIINTNLNIKNHIETYPEYVYQKRNELIFINFYNMIIFNSPEYEKIINSNNMKFLETNLKLDSFEISEANKLHQVVGVPKFVIQDLKDYKLEDLLEPIKELSTIMDGNSLKIVLEFLNNTKLLYNHNYTKTERIKNLSTFLMNIKRIYEHKYKITDLLNYLLKQAYYYCSNGFFSFPLDESMYLKDYIDMCEKYGLKYDRYPSQLKKTHDIIAKNVIALEKNSDILEDKFKKSVNKYSKVEKEIKIKINKDGNTYEKSYIFIVPKTIKELIEEGNNLHHCVGSFSDKIIDNIAHIVFMRESNKPKDSLVTIDIDENFNLVEAKKNFNEEIDEEQQKVLNKWLKEIKPLKYL